MAGGTKSFFDRILRTEGTIAFLQRINSVISYALGGGFLTTIITWFQGALSQYGFAGYVIVFLVVSTLIIFLLRLISDFRQQSMAKGVSDQGSVTKPDIPERTVSLEVAAIVSGYMSVGFGPRDGVNRVLQKASDGKIEVWASQINSFGSTAERGDYGPSHKIDLVVLREIKVVDMDEGLLDAKLYGKYTLRDENTGKNYGKIEVDLSKLLYS